MPSDRIFLVIAAMSAIVAASLLLWLAIVRRAAIDVSGHCYTPRRMSTPNYPTAIVETEHGPITVELWDDVAPKHAENFLKLARKGFYDGLSFHRIIPGFVIQGGCPRGDGTGGPGWTVKAEFNDRKHVPGVLSAARSAHPDSAGSQFFVCLSRDGASISTVSTPRLAR